MIRFRPRSWASTQAARADGEARDALGEEIDVRRIAIARGDSEIVGRPGRSLDGWRQHSGGGRRGLPGAPLADQGDGHLAFGQLRGDREADQPSTHHDDLSAQLSAPPHFLS